MNRHAHRSLALTTITCTCAVALIAEAGDWPSFRGPQASGVAPDSSPPIEWNVETGENIRWQTAIPGLAHSSPVIAGGRLFVTTAVREGGEAELKVGLYGNVESVEDDSVHQFKVYCLDKHTGDVIWEKLAIEGVPKTKRHPKGSHAASTPATDGEHVVAFFGSEGLYCYDIEGNLKWSKDFGVLPSGWYMMDQPDWGFASSPVIHGDKVIVQCDVNENSFLTALDLATGEELWRTPRNDVPTWSTPTILEVDGRELIICNGYRNIGGYDLETGEEIWSLEGGGDIPVPTPIVHDETVIITNAHGRMAPIIAIDTDASGELELTADDDEIKWMHDRLGNYMQTPLIYEDLLLTCNDAGIMSCFDLATGERIFRSRLGSGGSGYTASPVAADGRIYYTSEIGEIHVVKIGREFEQLALNEMGVECMASPAISGDTIYWRTRNSVIAVGEDDETVSAPNDD